MSNQREQRMMKIDQHGANNDNVVSAKIKTVGRSKIKSNWNLTETKGGQR